MSNIPKTDDQVDQWRSVMFLYDSALKKVNTKIEILNNEFVSRYDYNPIEHIKSRLKTAESIVKKLKKDGYEVSIENMMERLSDIAGIRIICSFTSDIYQIADMIASQGDVTVLHVKDYIKNPKPNGYRSYHLIIEVPVFFTECKRNMRVEVQIRTAGEIAPVSVEQIQDWVEQALMQQGCYEEARHYILYRQEHAQLRGQIDQLRRKNMRADNEVR